MFTLMRNYDILKMMMMLKMTLVNEDNVFGDDVDDIDDDGLCSH